MTPTPETIILLIDSYGHLAGFHQDGVAVTADLELVEWPIAPLRSLGPDNAYQIISSDSAELGKLGSIDVLLQIALHVAAEDGWECLSVLPGQFGQNVYPPSLTAVFRRAAR